MHKYYIGGSELNRNLNQKIVKNLFQHLKNKCINCRFKKVDYCLLWDTRLSIKPAQHIYQRCNDCRDFMIENKGIKNDN
jgi:hypothetical protein